MKLTQQTLLNAEQLSNYKDNPNVCPACGDDGFNYSCGDEDDNILVVRDENDPTVIYLVARCNTCSVEILETYTLTDVANRI